MKKTGKITKGILLLTLFLGWGLFANAQMGDPPLPPGGGHNQNNNQPPGGGAPIGSGVAILLGLGAAYGGRKVYSHWQQQEETIEE
ncbi:MAG TPA: hypothetical protein VFC92_07750 [Bacteroidales bacterium]|nr:hypothetical protein [Bacteroidales bacterium]